MACFASSSPAPALHRFRWGEVVSTAGYPRPCLVLVGTACTPTVLLILSLLLCLTVSAAAQDPAYLSALARARQAVASDDLTTAVTTYEEAAQAATSATERAQAWWEEASVLDARGQQRAALQALEKLVALTPPTSLHPSALERLARICQRTGDLDRSLSAYRTLATWPGATSFQVEQGLVGQLRMLQQMGNLEAAREVAAELLKSHPTSPYATQATTVLVDAAVEKADYKQALRLAQTEARRLGGDPFLLLRLAGQLQSKGRLTEAVDSAEALLALRPEDAGAFQVLFEINRVRGTLPAYEKQLQTATEAPAAPPAAFRRLADFYTRNQDSAKALSALVRLAALRPDDAEILAGAGHAALQARQWPEAVRYLQHASDLQPEDTRLQAELGDAYAGAGDREKALAAWKRSTGYDPAELPTVRSLGAYLTNRGYYADALAIYTAARETTKNSQALAVETAQVYEAQLFIDRAVSEYLVALRDPETSRDFVRHRLQALAADDTVRKDLLTALEAARKAGSLPEDALSSLSVAYLRDGRLAEAVATFESLGDVTARSLILSQTALDLDQAGDWPAARQLYELALNKDAPADVQALVALKLAAGLLAEGDWRSASAALQKALESPLSPKATLVLRLALADVRVLCAGDAAGAEELYRQVLAGAADSTDRLAARWGLADCFFVTGRYEEAIPAYQAFLPSSGSREATLVPEGLAGVSSSLPLAPWGIRPMIGDLPRLPRPTGPDYAAFQLAQIAFRQGNRAKALEQFEALARSRPDSPFANDALSRVLLIRLDFTGESPSEAKYLEALQSLDRGDLDKAKRVLQMISSLGPDEPLADDAALLLAQGLARFGTSQEALHEYGELFRRFPESPLIPGALLEASRIGAGHAETRPQAVEWLRQIQARWPSSPQAGEADAELSKVLRLSAKTD